MSSQHLQNVALVGASGSLGSKVLDAILKQGKHSVTVLTRTSSKATFSQSVKVREVDYNDTAGLEAALAGNDVVILMLAFAGLRDEERIIRAAAHAGVPYVIPSQFGLPLEEPFAEEARSLAFVKERFALYERIRTLGMTYVIVATNPWLDWSLQYNALDINVAERTARVITDSIAFNTTTLPKIGQGVAKFLALPRETIDRQFANGYLYLSSFQLTHPQLFEAVLTATGTSEADWKVERTSFQTLLDDGKKKVETGQVIPGSLDIIHGLSYKGADYTAKLDNDLLGLDQEDLQEVVRAAVKPPTDHREGIVL